MISHEQEKNLSNAAMRVKYKQDKTHPMVINVHDGRLMPNNAMLRAHKDYRVYTGSLTADLPTRMRWLEGFANRPKLVNSAEAADNFDVGKATKDELVAFALEQYGAALDGDKHIAQLRKDLLGLYEKFNASVGETALT